MKCRVIIGNSNPIPGQVSVENSNSKRYMHPYIHSSSIHNNRDMEKTQCPLTDEWMQKMWYIYTMEYYSAIKGQNNAICSTMDAAKDYQ